MNNKDIESKLKKLRRDLEQERSILLEHPSRDGSLASRPRPAKRFKRFAARQGAGSTPRQVRRIV